MDELTDKEQDFVDKLRQKLSDTRFVLDAFSVASSDQTADGATVEYDGVNLMLETEGGLGTTLSIPVNECETVLGLVNRINEEGKAGFSAAIAELAEADHPAFDLPVIAPTDILSNAYLFRTRRFADSELIRIGEAGVDRHNLKMDVDTIPQNEESFGLTLAHIEALYDLANDAAKRRGMDADVKTLLDIAKALQDNYTQDMKRLMLYSSPTPMDEETESRSGDITVTQAYRRNLRYAGMPKNVGLIPSKPKNVIIDLFDTDGFIRIQWDRIKETFFHSLFIYRSTTPDIDLVLRPYSAPVMLSPDAVKIFMTRDQRITIFDDWKIESNTTYYYRLFIMNQNYEFTSSGIIDIRTGSI